MSYKWKPSKSAKKTFAINMLDEDFAFNYNERKKDKENKRRATSKFNYNSAGGSYVPTKYQHDFCLSNIDLFNDSEESANEVMYGYINSKKVHHDHIHIVNEKIRSVVTI